MEERNCAVQVFRSLKWKHQKGEESFEDLQQSFERMHQNQVNTVITINDFLCQFSFLYLDQQNQRIRIMSESQELQMMGVGLQLEWLVVNNDSS